MNELQKSNALMISCCGICCSLCYGYRSGNCPGCYDTGCKIVKCANFNNQTHCFLCENFPCELFEKGFDWDLSDFPTLGDSGLGVVKWKPYSDVYIMIFKFWKNKKLR